MRNVIIVLLLAFTASSAFASMDWRIDAPAEVVVAPGGQAEFDVRVTNTGVVDHQGAFLLRAFIAAAANVLIQNVISSDPRVECFLQGIIGGNQVYTCFCEPIGIAPQGSIVTKYKLGLPISALPGSRINVGITFQYEPETSFNHTVALVVGSSASPKLDITVAQNAILEEDDDGFLVMWQFAVKNVGDAPTQPPVDVDVSLNLSGGASAVIVGPENIEGHDANWPERGSVRRFQFREAIQPGQTVLTPPIRFWTKGAVRGRYEIRALVAGGGSPPDEVTHDSTPVNLLLREVAFRMLNPIAVEITGRVR